MQQEQEAEGNMTLCHNTQLQSTVSKKFSRAGVDTFEQSFCKFCHVKYTDFEVFSKEKTAAVPTRMQSHCYCSQTVSSALKNLLEVYSNQITAHLITLSEPIKDSAS